LLAVQRRYGGSVPDPHIGFGDSDKTVAAVRGELLAGAKIPHHEARAGSDVQIEMASAKSESVAARR
jgi:hypothetical protein